MKAPPPSLEHLPPPPPGRSGWPWSDTGGATAPAGSAWPRISVVTPSYGQAQYIEETIRSVLLQGYPDLEHIVVDGGSQDGTVDILRRYGAWVHWVSEPDRGQADAINKGLGMAQGDILAYLNSDDLYLPGALYAVAGQFQRQPKAGLVYGDVLVIDEAGQAMGQLPRHDFRLRRMIERGEFLPQQAVFWHRAVQDRIGQFDALLHYAMDYDFFIRAGRHFPVSRIPQPIACFRLHASSKTVGQVEAHWREALAVSERHGLRPWRLWYWIRRLRHWALLSLPEPIQGRLRRRLNRAHDPRLYAARDR